MINEKANNLEIIAAMCRRKVVRMVEASGCGHLGGALSCIDILATLYFHIMHVNPMHPDMPDRDRFILSAGHKCMALYAVLAQKGFFDDKILDTYGGFHTKIPGHPDMHKLPGVEANTGSLGHGLPIGVGMALGLRLNKMKSKVYVLLGDGELCEGSNWEAAAAAAHHKTDNLIAIVDNNGLQISGKTTDVMNMEPIYDRFRSFGWATIDIDGHNINEIMDVMEKVPLQKERPTLIVAHTIKGKGISFAEDQVSCHYWQPAPDALNKAITELDTSIALLREETN